TASTVVMSVRGTPTFRYSTNVSATPCGRASSATIRLAIDPNSVKFPANVETTASRYHVCVTASAVDTGKASPGFRSNTAGTLDTRFESTSVTTENGIGA